MSGTRTVTASIAVGVEVERRSGRSGTGDWHALALRPGSRSIPDWTVLSERDGVVRCYAGTVGLVVRSTEAARYRDNLAARNPAVHVVLRRTDDSPGWSILLATADPAEARAHARTGDDRVEAVPMPEPLRDWLAAFVARHHAEGPHRAEATKTGPRPAEPEDGFLGRWSRTRRAAAAPADRHAVPEKPAAAPPRAAPAAPPPPDLPSLEDLRTRGDLGAFLRADVPRALRKAWRIDPAIARHRPLVDYDWNVNAPGYGRPLAGDSPARLIESLFGHLHRPPSPLGPATTPERPDSPQPAHATHAEVPPPADPDDREVRHPSRHGPASPS